MSEDLQGPSVSFELARIYWTNSMCATLVAFALLIHQGVQFWRNPLYSAWSLQVFIPTLVGDFLFSTGYGMHHTYNYFHVKESNFPSSIINDDPFFCEITLLSYSGMMMQIIGLLALSWAPLHTLRCGKAFQPSKSKRYVRKWTIGGLICTFVQSFFYRMMMDTRVYRGIYCPGFFTNTPEMFVFMWFVPFCFGSYVYSIVMAARELTQLKKTTQSQHLGRIAREVRNLLIASSINFSLFNLLLFLQFGLLALGLEDWMSQEYVVVTGVLVKYNSIGDVLLVLFHARQLRNRLPKGPRIGLSFYSCEESPAGCRYQDLEPLENRGISGDFMATFASSNNVRRSESTQEVMEKFIKPMTSELECSYVELIRTWVDDAGHYAVDRPQYFVSHCWSDTFHLLVEQLICFSTREGFKDPIYFWVDIFAINQHRLGEATELPSIPRVIQASEAVLFTLNPWNSPKTLTRVWCLWEFLQAVKSEKKVLPTMPQREESNFVQTMRQDPSMIEGILTTIDVLHANATVIKDKEVIFEEIDGSLGVDEMNSLVKQNLKLCLQGVAIDRCFGGNDLPSVDVFFAVSEKTERTSAVERGVSSIPTSQLSVRTPRLAHERSGRESESPSESRRSDGAATSLDLDSPRYAPMNITFSKVKVDVGLNDVDLGLGGMAVGVVELEVVEVDGEVEVQPRATRPGVISLDDLDDLAEVDISNPEESSDDNDLQSLNALSEDSGGNNDEVALAHRIDFKKLVL